MNNIASNKVQAIRLVKGILDANRHLIIRYQFAFTITKLARCTDWICPISKYHYIENEALVTYIHSFRLTCTPDEYQPLMNIMTDCLQPEICEELKSYGLYDPGSFRYRMTSIRHSKVDFNGCFEDSDCKCIIL